MPASAALVKEALVPLLCPSVKLAETLSELNDFSASCLFIVSAIDKLFTLHYELKANSIIQALECLELANQNRIDVSKSLFFEKLPQIAKERFNDFLKTKNRE